MATLSLQAQPHRPHRHKKFRVRPEALGEGYETYDVVAPSSSSRTPALPAAPSIPDVEVSAPNATTPAAAAPAPQWEMISEKETGLRAARNALRLLFWGFVLLIMLSVFGAYRDWFSRFLDWLHQFPLPTR